jgi:flagellin
MTSQINGLTQGNRNANDGISLCQTAEGALDEVTNMLQRMRTLAVQSANGTNSSAERIAMNDEVKELQAEIKRIGSDTSYGGKLKIFGTGADKLAGDVDFQVGSHSNQKITVSFKSMSSVLGTALASFNTTVTVSSAVKSQSAIGTLDNMIANVDSFRAKLGATQNRLESAISNQENVIENVSDARSRIKDVDYASETAKMAQQQILQQASTAMLSQANQKNSIALNLLG